MPSMYNMPVCWLAVVVAVVEADVEPEVDAKEEAEVVTDDVLVVVTLVVPVEVVLDDPLPNDPPKFVDTLAANVPMGDMRPDCNEVL